MDQLEKAQQSLQSLRSQYEEKMTALQQQIKATESERDRVLKEIGECIVAADLVHVHVRT